MTDGRRALGEEGERIAREALERAGARILERNARVAGVRGELDLIMLDRRQIVFVEVKTRRSASGIGPEVPAAAVGARKQAKIRALAAAWLRENAASLPPNGGLRFDVVGVELDRRGRVDGLEHLRAAF